ncbi:MAG: WecB/TagA/CpsF family glycosyltransferase [Planctomyces sp.]|nr:WecB/TagA/CpsF family glycosyltransferase [Planctomyces sp.]
MKPVSIPEISLFGMKIHRVTLQESVGTLMGWMSDQSQPCRFVVTPNLDHAVQIQSSHSFREAYTSASLVVADGWPLVSASRLFSNPLPERVAGSDLVPALFDGMNEAGESRTVFLLGAAPGVAEMAAKRIQKQWPSVTVCGTDSPPIGFEKNDEECQRIIRKINQCNPDLLVVGFGAPKQELWLHHYHRDLSARVAIAGGATIDFLAGRQIRAPRWMQKLKLEWSHRLLTNPRRLTGRYIRNACRLPLLVYRENAARRRQPQADSELSLTQSFQGR